MSANNPPVTGFWNPSSTMMQVVCTSSTRPASPEPGQGIYETDTGRTLTWNGAEWHLPWNIPWGRVAYAQTVADQTGVGTAAVDLTGLSVTFTAAANRRYRIYAFLKGNLTLDGATRVIIRIADGANNNLQVIVDVAAGATWSGGGYLDVTPGAGSVTYKLRGESTGAAFTVRSLAAAPCSIAVDDIGPASNTVAAAASYPVGSLQVICTSSTRPANPVEGQQIFETDTDAFQAYNGAAWVPSGMLQWGSCTANFWQNATLTTTTTTGRYWKLGRYATVTLRLLAAQAGGANFIMVLFPSAAGVNLTPAVNAACGSFVYYDMGAQYRVGTVLAVPTSFGFQFRIDNLNNVMGSTPAITIAVGDIIDMSVTYETVA